MQGFIDFMLFKSPDTFEKVIAGFAWGLVLLFVGMFWGIYYEATFDYSVCEATDTYEGRHSDMWIQTIPGACTSVNNVMSCGPTTTIVHPARDWTVRLYICPESKVGDERFEKWRVEDKI